MQIHRIYQKDNHLYTQLLKQLLQREQFDLQDKRCKKTLLHVVGMNRDRTDGKDRLQHHNIYQQHTVLKNDYVRKRKLQDNRKYKGKFKVKVKNLYLCSQLHYVLRSLELLQVGQQQLGKLCIALVQLQIDKCLVDMACRNRLLRPGKYRPHKRL